MGILDDTYYDGMPHYPNIFADNTVYLDLSNGIGRRNINTIDFYFKIKKVIFHDPATIIIWEDGSKTVVKCDKDDVYDKEKGLMLCFMKRAFNNKGRYNNVFKEWLK